MIPALTKLRQNYQEFKTALGYIVISCLKTANNTYTHTHTHTHTHTPHRHVYTYTRTHKFMCIQSHPPVLLEGDGLESQTESIFDHNPGGRAGTQEEI